MYAPYGGGVLVGPSVDVRDGRPVPGRRRRRRPGRPRRGGVDRPARAGGGGLAQRGRAPSPSTPPSTSWRRIGWPAIVAHDDALALRLRDGLAAIDGVRLLGPPAGRRRPTLPVATFVVDGVHHALVAARLSAEHAIGVRHGCFCAHPYLLRLLGLDAGEVAEYRVGRAAGRPPRHPGGGAGQRRAVDHRGRRRPLPRRGGRHRRAAALRPCPTTRIPDTGDFWPRTEDAAWSSAARRLGASCARG